MPNCAATMKRTPATSTSVPAHTTHGPGTMIRARTALRRYRERQWLGRNGKQDQAESSFRHPLSGTVRDSIPKRLTSLNLRINGVIRDFLKSGGDCKGQRL